MSFVINWSPVMRDDPARDVVEIQGDTLLLAAQPFDFSPLPVGATLPLEAIGDDRFQGDVWRDEEGRIHVCLLLIHGVNAPLETTFPAPQEASDGIVEMPPYEVELFPGYEPPAGELPVEEPEEDPVIEHPVEEEQ